MTGRSSLFAQVLGQVSRRDFGTAVRRHQAAKGARPHLMLDHQGCLPCWALVTEGPVHEVTHAKA